MITQPGGSLARLLQAHCIDHVAHGSPAHYVVSARAVAWPAVTDAMDALEGRPVGSNESAPMPWRTYRRGAVLSRLDAPLEQLGWLVTMLDVLIIDAGASDEPPVPPPWILHSVGCK